jgi:hypothetical protein
MYGGTCDVRRPRRSGHQHSITGIPKRREPIRIVDILNDIFRVKQNRKPDRCIAPALLTYRSIGLSVEARRRSTRRRSAESLSSALGISTSAPETCRKLACQAKPLSTARATRKRPVFCSQRARDTLADAARSAGYERAVPSRCTRDLITHLASLTGRLGDTQAELLDQPARASLRSSGAHRVAMRWPTSQLGMAPISGQPRYLVQTAT